MYSLLIVDDNPADRRGIPTLLDWDQYGIEIAGSAANGQDALDFLRQHPVDIVLTDIVMPVMGGIELAQWLRRERPATKVLFMSCHSDFEFARSAVDMKIYGYVLKPMIPQEFEQAIRRVLEELAEEARRQSEKQGMLRQISDMLPAVREQFVKELLSVRGSNADEVARRIEFLGMPTRPGGEIAVLTVLVDEYETTMQDLASEEFYYRSYVIQETISALSGQGLRLYLAPFSGREYVVLVFMDDDGREASRQKLMDLAVRIHTGILEKLKLSTTIGISESNDDVCLASLLRRQSLQACHSSAYGGSNPIIRFDAVGEGDVAIGPSADLEEMLRQVKDIFSQMDRNAAEAFVREQFPVGAMPERRARGLALTIVNMAAVALIEQGHSFTAIFGRETAVWESLERLRTAPAIADWLLGTFRRAMDHIAAKSASKESRMVDTVKKIVQERYREPLTVDDISRAVFLSQRYANSLFKKETGKTIFEYLLEYRLEMAKKLLGMADSRVTAVAEQVGYDNKSYFALMFKRYTGLTPTDYKARYAR